MVAGRQNVPASAELVAEFCGTRESWRHTHQTDTRLGSGGFGGDSGLGSKRLVEEFIVHPNEIKRLRTGEAVVVTKRPPGARVVRIAQT